MTRGWGLVWGGLLVVAGALALLFNLGLIQPEQLDRILVLWPLILMLIGAEIVLARLAPRAVATITMSVIVLLVAAGSIGYVASAPPAHQSHRSFEARDTGTGAAFLRVELGSATIHLQTAALDGQAATASLDYASGFGSEPSLTWDAGARELHISRNGSGLPFGPATPDRLTVTLSQGLPWRIELDTGASTITADLTQLHLTRFDVNGGALTLRAQVGSPSGRVPLTVNGGASHIELTRSAGAPLHVELDGGANSLNADGQNAGGAVGSVTWSSPGYPAADAYTLVVEGGANQVTVNQAA